MPKDFANSQDLVDIKEIRENTVILKNGGLRQIIMVGGINFALKSEEEQNVMIQAYQNFLNGLDFQLQIIIHSRKINIDKYLEGLAQFEEKETSPILKNQTKEYREFIQGFVQKNAIMQKIFLAVVPFLPVVLASPEATNKFFGFFKKDKLSEEKSKQESEANLQESIGQLSQRVSQVDDGLKSIGLETTVLNKEQLVELFYNFYNPETVEREKINLPAEK